MTFDELFAEHSLTPEERMALVLHLATLRALATMRTLLGPNVNSQPCPTTLSSNKEPE